MIDRLPDLLQFARDKQLKIEEPKIGDYFENEKLSDFSDRVVVGHKYVKEIEVCVEQLQILRDNINSYVGPQKEEQLSNDLRTINEKVVNNQQCMQEILKQLQKMLEEAKSEDRESKNPETRIMTNLYGSLIKQFEAACSRFQATETDIRNILAERIIRGAQIVMDRPLTAEEKKEFVNDPQKVQMIYQDKLTVGASEKLKNCIRDITDRHEDIIRLEKSINQVHELFVQLATLVQLQGEIVDNIVANISTAKDYVLKAEVDIVQSKKNMQSARKKKCCILIIVMIIIVVIVAPILGVKLGSA